MIHTSWKLPIIIVMLVLIACAVWWKNNTVPEYDFLIRNATIYDGSGSAPFVADIAIHDDIIAAIGPLHHASAQTEIKADGLVVAPGFINMLSWATESLLKDGLSQSNIRQGVTLEVFGEGVSMGPLNKSMKASMQKQQADIKYDLTWTTLSQYLEKLENNGISPNVASFVGATTVREYIIGHEDRLPTDLEIEQMCHLVRKAMEEGAMGVGSSLVYAPAFYAKTAELISLAKVAAEYDGMYISHIRSEGNKLLEAVDEFIHIATNAQVRSEIYHLKAMGKHNWNKLEDVIHKIETARSSGLNITANIYTYTAGATGLNASMPPWVQEGGHEAWVKRLKNSVTRKALKLEISTATESWENFYLAAGSPENILLVGFKNPQLKLLTGKTLGEIARMRSTSVIETMMDLVVEDDSRVNTVYFLMSEENLRKKLALPWVSFGSDAASLASEGVFLKSNPHPRAYGNFARLLGKFVRDEKIIPMEEAIRRLTSLPATNLRLHRRGILRKGYFADVVLFNPQKIQDHATYHNPHKYSSGMVHVFVNGTLTLRDGQHTGAKVGRVIRGPGWRTLEP